MRSPSKTFTMLESREVESDDEVMVERLLSEKLLSGMILLEKACPVCSTPLVKAEQQQLLHSRQTIRQKPHFGLKSLIDDTRSSDESSSGTSAISVVEPVAGIPFCVSCQAHVVSHPNEVQALQQSDSQVGLAKKGSILVDRRKHVQREKVIHHQPVLVDVAYGQNRDDLDDGDGETVQDEVELTLVSVPQQPTLMQETPFDEGRRQATADLARESGVQPRVVGNAQLSSSRRKYPLVSPKDMRTIRVIQWDEDSQVTSFSRPLPSVKEEAPLSASTTEDEAADLEQIEIIHAETEKSSGVHSKMISAESCEEEDGRRGDRYQVPGEVSGWKSPRDASENGNGRVSADQDTPKSHVHIKKDPSEEGKGRFGDDDSPIARSRHLKSDQADERHSITSDHREAQEDDENSHRTGHQGSSIAKDTVDESLGTIDPNMPDIVVEEYLPEYSQRREIATKVLGKKMLNGFVLLDQQCVKCTMPLMEFHGASDCVVCPVLKKKALKIRKLSTMDTESKKVLLQERKQKLEQEIEVQRKAVLGAVEKMSNLEPPSQSLGARQTWVHPRGTSPATPESLFHDYSTISSKPTPVTSSSASSRRKAEMGKRFWTFPEGGENGRQLATPISEASTKPCPSPMKRALEIAKRTRTPRATAIRAIQSMSSTKSVDPTANEPVLPSPVAAGTPRLSNKTSETSLQQEDGDNDSTASGKSVPVAYQHPPSVLKQPTTSQVVRLDQPTATERTQQSQLSPITEIGSKQERGTVSTDETGMVNGKDQRQVVGDGIVPQIATRAKATTEVVGAMSEIAPRDEYPSTEPSQPVSPTQRFAAAVSETLQNTFGPLLSMGSDIMPPSPRQRQALEKEEERLYKEAQRAEEESLKRLASNEDEDDDESVTTVRAKRELELTEAAKRETQKVLKETIRLEELEKRRIFQAKATPATGMMVHLNVQEQRKILEEEANLRREIEEAIAARNEAELEARRLADERRAIAEARLLAALEDEATVKQQEAEAAVSRAKEAQEQVRLACRNILAKTIAEGEADAIAEVESIVRAEAEDYHEDVVPPTEEEVRAERWETLRTEGRAVMTRRLIAGWTVLPELCQGKECHGSPLVTDGRVNHCVVCGGTGDGKDGVYAVPAEEDEDGKDHAKVPSTIDLSKEAQAKQIGRASPSMTRSVEELEADFEEKRDIVSKEISRKMTLGWTLLDRSCPNCVMPLMTDEKGRDEVCMLCGVVGVLQSKQPKKTQVLQDSHVATGRNRSKRRSSTKRKTSKNTGTVAAPKKSEAVAREDPLLKQVKPTKTTTTSVQTQPVSTTELKKFESVETGHAVSKSVEPVQALRACIPAYPASLGVSKTCEQLPDKTLDKQNKVYSEYPLQPVTAEQPETVARVFNFKTPKSMSKTAPQGPELSASAEEIRLVTREPKSTHDAKQESPTPADQADERQETYGAGKSTRLVEEPMDAPGPQENTVRSQENTSLPTTILVGKKKRQPDAPTSPKRNNNLQPSSYFGSSIFDDLAGSFLNNTRSESPRVDPPASRVSSRRKAIDVDAGLGTPKETKSLPPLNPNMRSPKMAKSDVLTLEIPQDFDLSDEQSLRRLIQAAKTATPPALGIDVENLPRAHHQAPSPGMAAASLPQCFSSPRSVSVAIPSPSNQSTASSTAPSRGSSRLRVTPETQPRQRGRSRSRGGVRMGSTPVSSMVDSTSLRDDVSNSRAPESEREGPQVQENNRAPAPRPDGGRSPHVKAPRLPPKSTSTKNRSKQEIIMIGGPFDAELGSIKTGAHSLTSDNLDALLARIDETKAQLEQTGGKDNPGTATQPDLRGLIGTLAKAAEEMQQLDELDRAWE